MLPEIEAAAATLAAAGVASPRHDAEELPLGSGVDVGLADPHRLGVAPAHERPQLAQVVLGVEAGRLGGVLDLDECRDGVDAEARDPLVQPEAHHLGDLVAQVGVGDIEVRLEAVEVVQVVGAGLAVVLPDVSSPGKATDPGGSGGLRLRHT